MLSNVEPQSLGDAAPATVGDMPTTLPSSPTRRNPSSESLSDLFENKATISDPSNAEDPSSLVIESSGSDQYSDGIRPTLFHSRGHSLPRSVSDILPKGSSQLHPSPSPTVIIVPTETGDLSSQRASRSNGSPPRHSSAPSTPSANSSRTYSYVFTSSRQAQDLGGERLIGIVNPSISKSTLRIAPSHPPKPKPSRHPTLSPEAIRAHALGAVHAVSAEWPFQTLGRDRAVSDVVSPIEIPIQRPLPTPPGVQVDNMRTGIEYYVNAARVGRSPTAERGTASAAAAHTGPASFKGVSTSIPQNEEPVTKRPTRRRTKGYSKYIESESSEYSFTTNALPRSPSHDSSCSNSKASFDESITGLSCFGLIGSGTPVSVFGDAVMLASRKL